MEAEFTERESPLATKQDLLDIKTELTGEIRGVERRLELNMRDSEIRILRWNFLFWVTQLAAIAGILKLVR
jgi:hypothetical protein